MPTIIRGHTNAPSVLIGAKAADLIAEAEDEHDFRLLPRYPGEPLPN
jgi:choline dehydrogenase-like flavoprotein